MVECHLAKVDVEGSNPFSRSRFAGSGVVAAPDEGIAAQAGGAEGYCLPLDFPTVCLRLLI